MIAILQMPDLNLKLFRNQVYHCLGNAKNAVFELTDAALLTRNPKSLAELSLSPIFRRQWHSSYEAREDCNPSRDKMMAIYTQQIALNQRPLLVGDHSAWFRPDAVTLKERTYEHKPSRMGANRPIGVGFGYSTIAYIPEKQASWALPLLHERISSTKFKKLLIDSIKASEAEDIEAGMTMMHPEFPLLPEIANMSFCDRS